MMATIIQWNINSFLQHRSDLKLLVTGHNPSVVCLQETKAKENIKFKYFTSYDCFATATDGRACGGVSVLVKNSIPQKRVQLNTTLQAVAVRVTLHKTVTICCIYCPPSKPLKYC